MREYYKKFSYIWISLLAVLAIFLMVSPSAIYDAEGISFLQNIPALGRGILIGGLCLVIFFQFLWKQRNGKMRKVIQWTGIIVIALVLVDRIFLQFVDRVRYVSGLSETPEQMLDTMIYMAIKSRKIWLNGIAGTLKVSLFGTIIGFLLAIVLVFIRVNPPVQRDKTVIQLLKTVGITIEKIYVSVVRGTPMMVQGCVIYYAGFMVTRSFMVSAPISDVNRVWTFYMAALITVSLNTSAYLAEVLRGGVEALDRGQREACEALGFTKWQALTKVIFPQAVTNVLPSIANEFINNIKGTSVLNVFGFVELMFATSSVAGFYYKYLASYLIAAVLYYALTFSMTALMNAVMKKTGFIK